MDLRQIARKEQERAEIRDRCLALLIDIRLRSAGGRESDLVPALAAVNLLRREPCLTHKKQALLRWADRWVALHLRQLHQRPFNR